MRHEPEWDSDGRCRKCGSKYHCSYCGVPTNMYGMGSHETGCPAEVEERQRKANEEAKKIACLHRHGFVCPDCGKKIES